MINPPVVAQKSAQSLFVCLAPKCSTTLICIVLLRLHLLFGCRGLGRHNREGNQHRNRKAALGQRCGSVPAPIGITLFEMVELSCVACAMDFKTPVSPHLVEGCGLNSKLNLIDCYFGSSVIPVVYHSMAAKSADL
jgi:hypothetical protein